MCSQKNGEARDTAAGRSLRADHVRAKRARLLPSVGHVAGYAAVRGPSLRARGAPEAFARACCEASSGWLSDAWTSLGARGASGQPQTRLPSLPCGRLVDTREA